MFSSISTNTACTFVPVPTLTHPTAHPTLVTEPYGQQWVNLQYFLIQKELFQQQSNKSSSRKCKAFETGKKRNQNLKKLRIEGLINLKDTS
jgi:hypothetical protein